MSWDNPGCPSCGDSIRSKVQDVVRCQRYRTVKAAVNFIQTAWQQRAFVVGKGLIEEEVQTYITRYVALGM